MAIRASAAACEITPDDSIALAGFTGQRRMSQGSHYPLYASAVHIRGGAGGIIIISLDLHSLDPSSANRIRKEVTAATGTRGENIFIATTGCKSAPYAEHALYLKNDPCYQPPDEEYLSHIVEMSVKSASEAAVSSRPASIAIVNFENPGTGAFIVKGENGRVIAAVILHDDVPDYLGPENTMVSADFVGALRDNLTKRFGGEPVIAYIPSPTGDRILEDRAEYGEDEALTAGNALAASIIAQLKALKASDFFPNCSVGGKLIDLYSLPRKDLPSLPDASALLNAAIQMGANSSITDEVQQKFSKWALIEANRTMSMVMAYKEGKLEVAMQEYDPVYVQSVRVGPLKIIGIPCAVLRNCARHIASQCGSNVWLAQGVNGTLMGSVLTCSGEQEIEGRLLSAVFERDVAGRLISSVIKASSGE